MSGARHHRPVGDQQVGATFRAARIQSGKRQEDVATGAGVHRSCVSSVERGHLGDVPLRQLRAIATDLEIQLRLVASWHGADGVRIINERHSRMHELVAERLAVLSEWEFASEVSFSEWGERGVVDILAWHSLTRTLLIIELKTEIPDPAGLVAQVDRYRRLGPAIGRARGWYPLRVATWSSSPNWTSIADRLRATAWCCATPSRSTATSSADGCATPRRDRPARLAMWTEGRAQPVPMPTRDPGTRAAPGRAASPSRAALTAP